MLGTSESDDDPYLDPVVLWVPVWVVSDSSGPGVVRYPRSDGTGIGGPTGVSKRVPEEVLSVVSCLSHGGRLRLLLSGVGSSGFQSDGFGRFGPRPSE